LAVGVRSWEVWGKVPRGGRWFGASEGNEDDGGQKDNRRVSFRLYRLALGCGHLQGRAFGVGRARELFWEGGRWFCGRARNDDDGRHNGYRWVSFWLYRLALGSGHLLGVRFRGWEARGMGTSRGDSGESSGCARSKQAGPRHEAIYIVKKKNL